MNEICEQMAEASEEQLNEMMEEMGTIQDLLMAHDFYICLLYTSRVSAFDGGDVKRVYIQSSWEPVETADIGRNGKVRQKGGVKSPIVTDVFKDDEVVVLDTMESWSKVATPDGHMGYIQNRFLKNIRAEQPVSDFEAPVYLSLIHI